MRSYCSEWMSASNANESKEGKETREMELMNAECWRLRAAERWLKTINAKRLPLLLPYCVCFSRLKFRVRLQPPLFRCSMNTFAVRATHGFANRIRSQQRWTMLVHPNGNSKIFNIYCEFHWNRPQPIPNDRFFRWNTHNTSIFISVFLSSAKTHTHEQWDIDQTESGQRPEQQTNDNSITIKYDFKWFYVDRHLQQQQQQLQLLQIPIPTPTSHQTTEFRIQRELNFQWESCTNTHTLAVCVCLANGSLPWLLAAHRTWSGTSAAVAVIVNPMVVFCVWHIRVCLMCDEIKLERIDEE